MKILRKLYDWVLSWADSPYGLWALAFFAFAESSFFPVPPDVLLIALVLGEPKKAFKFAAVCSLFSVIGGLVGYGIGHFVWLRVDQFFFKYIPGFTPEVFALIEKNYQTYGFWYVFTAGFTPIPYKVFTIGAGVFQLNIVEFLVASLLSRSARFFLVSVLLYKFGEPIKSFIDKFFNLLSFVFIVLLILGFVVIKMIF